MAERLGVSTAIPKSGGGDLVKRCDLPRCKEPARWALMFTKAGGVFSEDVCDAHRLERMMIPGLTNYKERRRRA